MISFRVKFFIEIVKLFVLESKAAETVGAGDAFFRKMAVSTILAVEKVGGIEGFFSMDALVKQFRADYPIIIDIIFSPNGISVVIAVFVEVSSSVHVAIFIIGFLIYKVRILVI